MPDPESTIAQLEAKIAALQKQVKDGELHGQALAAAEKRIAALEAKLAEKKDDEADPPADPPPAPRRRLLDHLDGLGDLF